MFSWDSHIMLLILRSVLRHPIHHCILIRKNNGSDPINIILNLEKSLDYKGLFRWKLQEKLWYCCNICATIFTVDTKSFTLPVVFIRPFEKRTYYAMAMSVRLSVRPSVRPSVRVFRTFFQHALRYQIETWYMHLVGDTTCRVWVSSQLGHFDLVYSQM